MRPHEARRLLALLTAPLGAALLVLLSVSISFAQGMGLWQVGPSIPGRSVCTSITHPVTGMTWCFDGNTNPGVIKVWNGTTYVTVGGGGGGITGLTAPRIPFATSSTTIGDDPNMSWNATTSTIIVKNAATGVSPVADVTYYGASPSASGATNRAAFVAADAALSGGGKIYVPRGSYTIDGTTITLANATAIECAGSSATTIHLSANPGFDWTATSPVTLKDCGFSITGAVVGFQRGPASEVLNATLVDGVQIEGGSIGFNITTNALQNKVVNSQFLSQTVACVSFANAASFDRGDNVFANNQCENAGQSGLNATVGGLRVIGNKFIGGQTHAILFGPIAGSAGLEVIGNDIASYTSSGITVGGLYSNINIAGNAMGGGGISAVNHISILGVSSPNDIARITITGNVIQATDTGDVGINLQYASILTISGNTYHGFLNSKWVVADNVNDAQISSNRWLLTSPTLAYTLTSTLAFIVNDDNLFNFAGLPSGVSDGSRISCSDCAIDTATGVATSGGTGMIATRLNGGWYGFDATGNVVAATNLYTPGLADGCMQVASGLVTSTGVACGGGGGGGSVTSVAASATGIFSWTGSPITTTGTLGLVTTGTSGGVVYFSGATTTASSPLLTNHAPMIGGGAGAAPKTTAALTNGQTLMGVTGSDPVPGLPTAGTNITITPSSGGYTIDAAGSGISGSGASVRCAYWTGTASLGSDSACNWDTGNHTLVLGATTSISGVKLEVRGGKTILSQNTGTLPSVGSMLYLAEVNGTSAQMLVDSFGAAASSLILRRADTSVSAPSALQNGDKIGNLGFRGYKATAYSSTDEAEFACWAGATWTDSSTPTFCTIATTPVGSTTPVEAFRINTAGAISVGTWQGTAIGAAFGGTGTSSAAWTGVPSVSGGVWSINASLPVSLGGTGITSYTIGDLLYASGTTTLSKRAAVAVGQTLISQGVGVAPIWSAALGLNVAAAATAGTITQTIGANGVQGILVKRFTDSSPSGNFFLGQTAAGVGTVALDVQGQYISQLSANGLIGAQIQRFTDTSPTGDYARFINAAGTKSVYKFGITGELKILQDANGINGLWMLRATDSSPTGFYLAMQNAAGTQNIWTANVLGSTVINLDANAINGLTIKRNTNTSPSGNFFLGQDASSATKFLVDVLGHVQVLSTTAATPQIYVNQTTPGNESKVWVANSVTSNTSSHAVVEMHVSGAGAGGSPMVRWAEDSATIWTAGLDAADSSRFKLVNGTGGFFSDAIRLSMTTAGLLGINTNSQASTLTVNGNAAIGASYVGTAAPSNGMLVQGNSYFAGTTFGANNSMSWDASATSLLTTKTTLNSSTANRIVVSVTGDRYQQGIQPIPDSIYGVGNTLGQETTFVGGQLISLDDQTNCNTTTPKCGLGLSGTGNFANAIASAGQVINAYFHGAFTDFGIGQIVQIRDERGNNAPASEHDLYGTLYLIQANSAATFVFTASVYSIVSRLSASNQGADVYGVSSNFVNDANFHGVWMGSGDATNLGTEYKKGDAFRVGSTVARMACPSCINGTMNVDAWTNAFNITSGSNSTFLVTNHGKTMVAPGAFVAGNTHSNTTVDNIGPDTTNIVKGMPVSGSGIPNGTIVASVDSSTQVTLSAAATTSVTSNGLTFGGYSGPTTDLDIITAGTANTRGLMVRQYTNDATINSPALLILYRAQGTPTTPTALTTNSGIGAVAFKGYDGTTAVSATENNVGAVIGAVSPGAWSNTSHQAYLSFQTTAASSTTVTERMRLDQNGLTVSRLGGLASAAVDIEVQDAYGSTTVDNMRGIAIRQSSTGNSPASLNLWRSANGGLVSHTALVSGDQIGSVSFQGDDGTTAWSTSYRNVGAVVGAVANGTWSTSSFPAYLSFLTTPAASTTPTERLRINSTGDIYMYSLGTASDGGTVHTLCIDTSTNKIFHKAGAC